MTIMKKLFQIFSVLLIATACSNSDSNENAQLEIRLTDAPGDYEEVNIDIQSVEINASETDSDSGWKTIDVHRGVYNLLKLTNGLDTVLSHVELPAGHISQIRLILGENNSVKKNGVITPLKTPSAQQSGLKVNVNADLTPGITYTILLDFDAARSVVEKGNGGFNLKPVIRGVSEATSGAIKGVIVPAASKPAIFAVNMSGDTVATTYSDTTSGKFLLRGVDPGTYTIRINPKPNYQPTVKTDVSVSLGVVTDVGVVNIP